MQTAGLLGGGLRDKVTDCWAGETTETRPIVRGCGVGMDVGESPMGSRGDHAESSKFKRIHARRTPSFHNTRSDQFAHSIYPTKCDQACVMRMMVVWPNRLIGRCRAFDVACRGPRGLCIVRGLASPNDHLAKRTMAGESEDSSTMRRWS